MDIFMSKMSLMHKFGAIMPSLMHRFGAGVRARVRLKKWNRTLTLTLVVSYS